MDPLFDVSMVRVAYVLVFAVATAGCLLSLGRARRVEHRGTRNGLVGVLAASGVWAASHALFISLPPGLLARAVYVVGLAVGFSTVFAWLYFCSAYTGRTLHQDPTVRRVGLATYLGVVAVKLTNPVHGYYFTVTETSTPFRHLAVQHGVLHWVATGFSYVLAAVGLFMLFERFRAANYDTRAVSGLVALTAVPVAMDLVGYATPVLLDVIYAPLGVAAFAVGVLYVHEDRFLAVQLTGDIEDAIVLLDEYDTIKQFNRSARALFPGLVGAAGDPISSVPALADAVATEGSIVEYQSDGEQRYYLTSTNSFGLGGSDIGRIVLFSDVTEIERKRREVARHNEQLEGFTEGIRHELRNAVGIVDGYVDLAASRLDDGEVNDAHDALREAAETSSRMSRTVDDFATVAEYGRTVESTSRVDFRAAVADARTAVGTVDVAVEVSGDGRVLADKQRLQALFENVLRFADRPESTRLEIALREDGFEISDDGRARPDAEPEAFFDYGDAVPSANASVTLPTVRTLARVHGWSSAIDTSYEDGVRVVVTGVEVELADSPDVEGTDRPT